MGLLYYVLNDKYCRHIRNKNNVSIRCNNHKRHYLPSKHKILINNNYATFVGGNATIIRIRSKMNRSILSLKTRNDYNYGSSNHRQANKSILLPKYNV